MHDLLVSDSLIASQDTAVNPALSTMSITNRAESIASKMLIEWRPAASTFLFDFIFYFWKMDNLETMRDYSFPHQRNWYFNTNCKVKSLKFLRILKASNTQTSIGSLQGACAVCIPLEMMAPYSQYQKGWLIFKKIQWVKMPKVVNCNHVNRPFVRVREMKCMP